MSAQLASLIDSYEALLGQARAEATRAQTRVEQLEDKLRQIDEACRKDRDIGELYHAVTAIIR